MPCSPLGPGNTCEQQPLGLDSRSCPSCGRLAHSPRVPSPRGRDGNREVWVCPATRTGTSFSILETSSGGEHRGGLPRVEKLLPVGQEWTDHLRSCGYPTHPTCGPPISCGDSTPSCIHPAPPVDTPHPPGDISPPPGILLPPPRFISPPPGNISPSVVTHPLLGTSHPLGTPHPLLGSPTPSFGPSCQSH